MALLHQARVLSALLLLVLPAALGQGAAPSGFAEHGESYCSSLPHGTRLFTKPAATVAACAALCTATPTCVCFDFKPGDETSGCRGVNQVKVTRSPISAPPRPSPPSTLPGHPSSRSSD